MTLTIVKARTTPGDGHCRLDFFLYCSVQSITNKSSFFIVCSYFFKYLKNCSLAVDCYDVLEARSTYYWRSGGLSLQFESDPTPRHTHVGPLFW